MVWVLGLLAASPELHAYVHGDADHAEHTCAVTLFSQGLETPASAVVLVVEPSLLILGNVTAVEPARVDTPVDWLQPGRGPPLR